MSEIQRADSSISRVLVLRWRLELRLAFMEWDNRIGIWHTFRKALACHDRIKSSYPLNYTYSVFP